MSAADPAPPPWEHPFAGVELPSGRFLTFPPSEACDCADCQEARAAGWFKKAAA